MFLVISAQELSFLEGRHISEVQIKYGIYSEKKGSPSGSSKSLLKAQSLLTLVVLSSLERLFISSNLVSVLG